MSEHTAAPNHAAAGVTHRAQLEKAIEVVLAELKKSPPAKTARPAYPLKGKTQRGTVPAGTK